MKVEAVVFDLDDTLISESQYQQSARRAVLEFLSLKVGIELSHLEAYATAVESGPRAEFFQRLLSKIDAGEQDISVTELVSVHRNHEPSMDWYPDVIPSIEALRELGVKLGIITDGYSVAQHQKLNSINASRYFDAIVVSDDLGAEFWKPHPRVYEEVSRILEIDLTEMIYVGDNPEKDFYISKSLGIPTVKIERNDSLKSQRPYRDGIKETYQIKNLDQLTDLICKINSEASHEKS